MYRPRVAPAALLACLVLGGVPALAQEPGAESAPAEGVSIEPLFQVELDAEVLPQDLAGVLVFRKIYPADTEISYNAAFIPPNTFVRYVESGRLGLRPHSEIAVMRGGATPATLESIAAETDTSVGPGDTFIMSDPPYEDHGPDALGTMWHEDDDDATVVGFAIREARRCCAMDHAGMRSPWHATIAGPSVQALIGQPITVRMERVHIEPGAALALGPDEPATMRLVDEGQVAVTRPAVGETEARTISYAAGRSFTERPFGAATDYELSNPGTEPAVLLQLTIEPTDPED